MEVNFGILFCYLFLMCNVSEEKYSVCAQQSVNIGGELNYPCTSVKDCKDFGYVCKENTCQCDQWYVPDRDRKKCLGGVDQKCLYDEHCINGAFCMNQSVCKCKHSSSQALDHGLVCAGVSNLKQQLSSRLTFLVIGIAITVFGGTST